MFRTYSIRHLVALFLNYSDISDLFTAIKASCRNDLDPLIHSKHDRNSLMNVNSFTAIAKKSRKLFPLAQNSTLWKPTPKSKKRLSTTVPGVEVGSYII